MDQKDQPLFTLTVRQFSELTRNLVAEEVKKLLAQLHDENYDSKNESDICRADEACQITGIEKSTLYSKVSLEQIPSLTRRRPLLFSKKYLRLWIEAGRPKTNDLKRIYTILQQKGINGK
jgi:hypothetical protein